jgi:hypothetical protein
LAQADGIADLCFVGAEAWEDGGLGGAAPSLFLGVGLAGLGEVFAGFVHVDGAAAQFAANAVDGGGELARPFDVPDGAYDFLDVFGGVFRWLRGDYAFERVDLFFQCEEIGVIGEDLHGFLDRRVGCIDGAAIEAAGVDVGFLDLDEGFVLRRPAVRDLAFEAGAFGLEFLDFTGELGTTGLDVIAAQAGAGLFKR